MGYNYIPISSNNVYVLYNTSMYIIYLLTICIVYDEEKFLDISFHAMNLTYTAQHTRNMKNQQQLQQQKKKKKKVRTPHKLNPLPLAGPPPFPIIAVQFLMKSNKFNTITHTQVHKNRHKKKTK